MDPSTPTQGTAIQFSDFLNPASMLTPGLAGAMTMMISNALLHAFGLNPAYTALALSFLLGTIVWVATAALLARCIYYVFNSLIIFSVAFGANSFALTTNAPSSISLNLIGVAYAQAGVPSNGQNGDQAKKSQSDLEAKLNELVQNAAKSGTNSPIVIAQKNDLAAIIKNKVNTAVPVMQPEPKKTSSSPSFFQPWHF